MMFRCFVCKSAFHSIQLLVRHLKLSHAFFPGMQFQLVCDQNGCRHRFCSFSGFRKHLQCKHNAEILDPAVNEPVTPSVVVHEQRTVLTLISEQPVNSQSCIENRQHTQEMCASLIAKLQSSGVATNVVKTVVANMEELVEELHSTVKEDVIKLLPDEGMRAKFDEYFDSLENPFSKLNTETKLKKYFSEKCGLVEPVEVALGVRYDTRRNRDTGTYEQVPVTDKFVYIPLLETLKLIFNNKEICDHILQPCEKTGVYKDFCDGNYFKDPPPFL